MFVEQEEILRAANGGLDIIFYYYPQARHAFENGERKFKIRDEKTPSASIKQLEDGNWVVTDFGDDQVPRNAIHICMKEEELTFREAIVTLANRLSIGGISTEINKPVVEMREASPEEKEGEYYFDVKDVPSKSDLDVLGPAVSEKVCANYNVFSLKSFTYIKNRKAYITKTTEAYPIFLFEHGEWKKLYQPLNPDKQYRFRYIGQKEKDYINGLTRLQKAYKDVAESDEDIDGTEKSHKFKKIDFAIICAGDRDALNLAGLGYFPVWLNSETASLSEAQYRSIAQCVENVCILPDLDTTGVRSAISLGLKFMDLRFIWLPDVLSTFRDARGKPRKDFRDYIEIYPSPQDFRKLVNVAMPLRFWNIKITDRGEQYKLSPTSLMFFLRANGFGQVEYKNAKTGYVFAHVDNNIVREIRTVDIRRFLNDFCEERHLPIQLRDMLMKDSGVTDTLLQHLKPLQVDFEDFGPDFQYIFFKNRALKVSASEIQEIRLGDTHINVWEDKVVQHNFKLQPEQFKITYDEASNEYDIDILNHDSNFFCYLINASREFWRDELEYRLQEMEPEQAADYRKKYKFAIDGPLLSSDEIKEQKAHLINKIFSIGYLMHSYKNIARPWAVYATDSKISEDGESHGRSGKSFCYSSLDVFKKRITLPGRNLKTFENLHVYDRVTEYTDYVLVDDADKFLPFGFFYDTITGVMTVNPKNNQSYEIPFAKSPKFCFTSNFPLANSDDSTEARILYTTFSDYYHEKSENNDYLETRKIADDFGKNLFGINYTDEEWNADLNFYVQCLKFYLSVPSPKKINAPSANLLQRKLIAIMGNAFLEWASVYFDQAGMNANQFVVRRSAFEDFLQYSKLKTWSMQRFSRALKAFCRFSHYTLNPEELCNSDNRIIRKIDGETKEMIFVKTKAFDPVILSELNGKLNEDEKPF